MHILGTTFVSKTFEALTPSVVPNGSALSISELREAFSRFDLDKNGTISRDELASVMTDFGNRITLEEADLILANVDRDGNGVIDFQEFLVLMAENEQRKKELQADPDAEIKQMFQQIDVNGDGFISEKELKQMMKTFNEKAKKKDVKKMMKFADTNKDGKISFSEFKLMVQGNMLG